MKRRPKPTPPEPCSRSSGWLLSAADKILATFGPDEGYVHQPEIGLIIASESVVAHDMVSLAWLLENRRRMPAEQKDGFLDRQPPGGPYRQHLGRRSNWGD